MYWRSCKAPVLDIALASMYIDDVYMFIRLPMPIQIANPTVVSKIDRLARATGLTKTAAVEQAVDRMIRETERNLPRRADELTALLAQLDQVPDRPDAFDPLEWDERGLPV